MQWIRFLKKYLTPRGQLARWVVSRTERTVHAGPFQGMRYIDQASCSAYMPKLLGTYERELYPLLERVAVGGHDTLVDVGVAEGYFAVGLAIQCDAQVVGYECDEQARRLARDLSVKNGVSDRVTLNGECQPHLLEQTLGGAINPFVLCDVEGYEATLLDPHCVPSLLRTTMLVELHEFWRPGLTAELFRRFGDSHEIQIIWQSPRTTADFPLSSRWLKLVPRRTIERMVDERRDGVQSWLWMVPAHRAQPAAA